MNIPTLNAKDEIALPASGTWPKSVHVFDQRAISAVRAALATQRPLLVKGEPGMGKSQLARAVAHAFNWHFVSEVVHAHSEASDLLWHFDAVARLGEAQALAQAGKEERATLLNPERFLSPGVLWWVFNRQSAKTQYQKCVNPHLCTCDVNEADKAGTVLLIDEIDKADSDFPNSLLETLGNGAFPIPYIGGTVSQHNAPYTTLVIITSNNERDLPLAFIRRCLVLELKFAPEGDPVSWLMKFGESHFGTQCSVSTRRLAAEMLMKDRNELQDGLGKPGLAEYLDILRAVTTLELDQSKQDDVLKEISEFSLKKYQSMESL